MQVLSVVASVIYARTLGPAGFGSAVLLLLLPQIASKFGGLGVGQALSYHVNVQPERKHDYISTAIVFNVFVAMGVAGVLLVAEPWIYDWYYQGNVSRSLLHLVFLASPFWTMHLCLSSVLKALGRFGAFNLLTAIVPTVLGLGAATVFIVGLQLGVEGYVYAQLLVASTVFVLMLATVWRAGFIRPGWSWQCFRQLASYGLRGYLTNFSSTLATNVDRLFIGGFLGPAEVGVYQIALGLTDRLMIVSRSVGLPMVPKIAGIERGEAIAFCNRLLRRLLLLLLPATVVAVVLGPFVIRAFYGSAYAGASVLLAPLALAMVFRSLKKMLTNFYLGTGRPEIKSFAGFSGLGLSALFLYLLVPVFRQTGAALALLAADIITFAGMYVYYRQREGLGASRILWPSRSDAREVWRSLSQWPTWGSE